NCVIVNGHAVGTIQNDDASLSINNVSVTEGNVGTANATFTISLSAAMTSTVTVAYATSKVTATAATDYVTASGVATVPAGQTSTTVTILVIGDTMDEPDETFNIKLSSSTNAIISAATGVGTILDDDPTPTLSIN